MIIKTKIYIVYGQDMEGRDTTPHYFFDKRYACEYAMACKGKIAYGIPTICEITVVFNTEDIGINKYAHSLRELSENEIQCYAKGDE